MYYRPGKKYDVVSIAQAMVDILAYVDQDFLDKHNFKKGTMELIDEDGLQYMQEHIRYIKLASGGSAANTMAGIASFGGKVALIAKVQDDEFGTIFKRDIGMCGIDFCGTTAKEGQPTGRCYVAISKEDAERTMRTYLGIADKMCKEDIDEKIIQNSSILYIEGYLLDREKNKDALSTSIKFAHKYEHKIAMTLSDARCVEMHRSEIMKLLPSINLLFANEEEIKTLFKTDNLDYALNKITEICELATITRGKIGSVVVNGSTRIDSPSYLNPKKIVDTTGAGDLYASGFLYGMIKNKSLKDCALLGNMAASEVISHMGARPEIALSSLLENL